MTIELTALMAALLLAILLGFSFVKEGAASFTAHMFDQSPHYNDFSAKFIKP